jgi:hypothetical protein
MLCDSELPILAGTEGGILTHTEHVLVSLFDRVFNAGSCTAAIVAYDGRNRTASKRPIETDFQEPRFQ